MNRGARPSWVWLLPVLLIYCVVAKCAKPPDQPVVLPVVDGTDIRFNHVFFGKGPAHSKAHRIVQDRQGYLWLATADRLQRYDGYDVREFPPNRKDPNVLIQSLFKDKSGTLWAARDRGIGLDKVPFGTLDKYDPASGTFTAFPRQNPWFDAPVNNISQDRQGALWFSTSEGLLHMDPVTGRTVRYRHAADDPASLASNQVRSTLQASDGSFWVATTEGLDLFDSATAKVIQHIPLLEDLPAQNRPEALVIRLLEDHAGVLWAVLTYGHGLARVDRQAGKLIFYSLSGAATNNLSAYGARAIQEDRNGNLWIGTVFSGILKLDPDRKRFIHYRNNPSDPESLGGDAILDMFLDREGNMWAGTNDAGVDRFPTQPLPFKRYRHEPGNPNSLDTNYTTTVFEDSRGILWTGSRRALMALDRKSGRAAFYRKTGGPGELSDTWVYSVAEDRSGYLWFGTLNGGLNRFDRRSGQFKAYRHDPADPRSLSDNRVLRLFIDHKGALWAGTEKGLSVFDAAAGTFQTYLKDKRVRDIAEDAHGVLWIAARAAGLVRLDPAEKQETTYRLSSDKAWSVTVDRTGIVWVGTESGLNRFDPATQTSTAYYESDGLPDNSISHILEDERGDLWVSTHNGLSRFNPRAKTFQNYYVSDGLSGNEFYDNSSSFRSPSGEMFLSANGGLTAFFPRDIVDDQRVAPVVITSFKVFGKESPLKPVLSHSQNVVTFEFSTLSFTSPERNRYRYRLEPVEKEWNESQGDRRSITYALSPGDYTFRVQGSNSRDLWNEQGASVRFGIAKPWWNSWPFRTGVIVLVLLSLGYGYYLHLQKIRWEFSVRLDERVGERTRIARELHDTLLQSFQGALYEFQAGRNLLARGREEAVHTIDSAINNAQGAIAEGRAAIEDLRGTVSGQTRLEDLLKIAGTELASSQVSNGSGPVFRVIVEGRPQALAPVLHDDVHQIAREVIRNSFRHANASRIETEIRYDVSQFRVRVRDDGKGIDPKVLEVGMRPGHWGLPGSRERAKRIGARLTFWSEAGAGTEVELTIPARIAYAKRQ